MPRLLELGMERGHRCIVGSDPLPFQGEEKEIGTYAVLGQVDFELPQLKDAIQAFLTSSDVKLNVVGKRNSILKTVTRLLKNRISGRKPIRES